MLTSRDTGKLPVRQHKSVICNKPFHRIIGGRSRDRRIDHGWKKIAIVPCIYLSISKELESHQPCLSDWLGVSSSKDLPMSGRSANWRSGCPRRLSEGHRKASVDVEEIGSHVHFYTRDASRLHFHPGCVCHFLLPTFINLSSVQRC